MTWNTAGYGPRSFNNESDNVFIVSTTVEFPISFPPGTVAGSS